MILAIFLVVPTSILLFFPLSITVGVATGVILWLGTVALLWLTSPTITVDAEQFRAGRSRIEHHHIGSIEAVSIDRAREEKSTLLDARAWLVLRPWVGPAVKITVSDPDDPTPYWLVSTRQPERIVEAWLAARN